MPDLTFAPSASTSPTSPPEPASTVPTSRATARRPDDALRALAKAAARRLDGAPAEDVIAWAATEFGDAWAIACSMQDTVLAHLVARVAPGTTALFLDTGYHFDLTLATRDAVADRYPLRLVDVTPRQSVAEQDAAYGPRLHERDPDLCCWLRKTTPLAETLVGYEAWGTGIRRTEAATRAAATEVTFDETNGLVKVNPLVRWSDADVERYAAEYDVVRNPLMDAGYPSIGCAPCTRRVLPGEDPRAGRWSGTAKTECGIHR